MMRTGMRPGSPFVFRKLRATPAQSWKNGGGVTRELARGGGWRISVADVAADGAFSVFRNQHRHSVVFEGEGLDLASEAVRLALDPMDCASYDGGQAWQATLRGGPARVFNVMVTAGRVSAEVQVAPALAVAPAGGVCLALCVSGFASCVTGQATPSALARGDYILFSAAAGPVHFGTPGPRTAVLVAGISPAMQPPDLPSTQ